MFSFEILPVVEFFLSPDLTDAEATQILEREPVSRQKSSRPDGQAAQTLSLEAPDGGNDDDDDEDSFSRQLMHEAADGAVPPITLDAEALAACPRRCTFVQTQVGGPNRYFRAILQDLPVVQCKSCQHFFHEEEWEFNALQKSACPFCRATADISGNTQEVADLNRSF